MSKKYKGKICVYCSDRISTTGDHVFARELFLKHRRDNLPKVPACSYCNHHKSTLEHYVTALFPFGGMHQDASSNLRNLVPPRLAKNKPLHDLLDQGKRRTWITKKGLAIPTLALPLEWGRIEEWFVYIVKGLVWYHWQVLLKTNCRVDIIPLNPRGEAFIQQFHDMRPARRVSCDLGSGTLHYKGAQGVDNPQVSVWEFSVYGGIVMSEGSNRKSSSASVVAALVGPNHVFDNAERKANWLSGRGS